MWLARAPSRIKSGSRSPMRFCALARSSTVCCCSRWHRLLEPVLRARGSGRTDLLSALGARGCNVHGIELEAVHASADEGSFSPTRRASASSATSRIATPKAPLGDITGPYARTCRRQIAARKYAGAVHQGLLLRGDIRRKRRTRRNQFEVVVSLVHCQSMISQTVTRRRHEVEIIL